MQKEKAEYGDLIAVFDEFRAFRNPKLVDGVPDYTAAAMARQFEELKEYQGRLAAMDISEWPVADQVDYHLVRAEMNGLEFDHRVIKNWSRDPGFYCTMPRFEETMKGAVWIPHELPLPADKVEEYKTRLTVVPKLLAQGKENLVDIPGDLAVLAIKMKLREHDAWSAFATRIEEHHPELVETIREIIAAVDDFRGWLEANLDSFSASAGVGKENWNWFMKNVYLFPYTWEEANAVVQRELERSHTSTRLEEFHNKHLPEQQLTSTLEEVQALYKEGHTHLFDFLEREQLFKEPNYMQPKPIPTTYKKPEKLNFFQEILARDVLPLDAHDLCGHSPDSRRTDKDERYIRKTGRPYHICGLRAEGMATGIEEILMHMGLLDDRPRSRELAYILVGFRAARAGAALKMHANEQTFEEGLDYAAAMTPRGYAKRDSFLLWDDLELYIRQPGYGMGYLMGKVQLDKMIADCSRLQGEDFSFRGFFDQFLSAGFIPLSLIRWELTGETDEMEKLLG
jgi:hypothetical protein